MSTADNKKAVSRCIELFNKCTLEWVDTCYSKELVWIEMPTQSFPKGRSGGFETFRNTADQLLRIFPDRSLFVHRSVAEADYVVFEQEWKGTIAIPFGNYKVGENIKMKIVTFFKLKNSLIVEHTDYPISIL